jgi:hypothetical protein
MTMSIFPASDLDRAMQIFKPLPLDDASNLAGLAHKLTFWQKARR